MKIKLFLLSVFTIFSLYAEKQPDSEKIPIPLPTLEGEPSAIVDGVNVITGDYCENEVDLIIPGADHLTIARCYASSDYGNSSLAHGWNLNHYGQLEITELKIQKKGYFEGFFYREDYGSKTTYFCENEKPKTLRYQLNPEHIKDGLTNCGSGEISGKTNINNRFFSSVKKCKSIDLREGDGTLRSFHKSTGRGYYYNLVKEIKPNRNQYFYRRNQDHDLDKITLVNSNGSKIHSIYLRDKLFTDDANTSVFYNNEKKVVYNYKCVKDKFIRHVLESVYRSDAPNISYEYELRKFPYNERLTRRAYPNNRFKEISYYKKSDNLLGLLNVKISSSNDKRLDRVKTLMAPVGVDSQPIITHRFFYEIGKKGSGSTKVLDAINNKTTYLYQENRLVKIERFTGTEKHYLYSSDEFDWDQSGKLLSRLIRSKEGWIQSCRTYDYDKNGNVIKDTLWGNLTGYNNIPIEKHNGEIKNKNAEHYSISYRYSNDGFNLKTWESDGNKEIHYNYEYKSNRLASKFIVNEGCIKVRYFFEYDSNAAVVREIIDDGSTTDKNDFTGVTERRIKEIVRQTASPVGLPHIINLKYLDLESGYEKLIKREVNHYTKEGRLFKQDIYDSNENYAYSRHWEYDANGNVTKEIDPLGTVITRQYDENNNLISENFPTYQKTYLYDYSNRLIKEKKGNQFVKSFRYDHLGNKISEVNEFGQETLFEYDSFGRLIARRLPEVQEDGDFLKRISSGYSYNVLGYLTGEYDPKGTCIQKYYTIRGEPFQINYPDGSVESFVYNLDGTMKKSVAKDGTYTLYTSDYQQRPLSKEIYSKTGELLKKTTFTYDAFHLLSETDPAGKTVFYSYDGLGRLITVQKEDYITTYEYDNLGRRYKKNNGHYSEIKEFDYLDRIIQERVEDEQGNIYSKVEYQYDWEGNKTHITKYNQTGASIESTEYNIQKQPIKITDQLGNITHIKYKYDHINEQGQKVLCKEIIDPKGKTTVIIHDTHGRVRDTIIKNLLGEIIQKFRLLYDLNGNLTRRIDTVITLSNKSTQDGVGDCLNSQRDCEKNVPREFSVYYSYDLLNRLISINEENKKQTQYYYNQYGQKEKIVKPDGVEIHHTYDPLGRLESLISSDQTVHYTYEYDLHDNPIKVTDHIKQTISTRVYDTQNRLIEEELGTGLKIQFTYDSIGRVLTKTHQEKTLFYEYQGPYLKKINYGNYEHIYEDYDQSGNLLKTNQISYEYDKRSRPTKIDSPYWSESIVYDEVDNILQKEVRDSESEYTVSYQYDDLYQLIDENGDEQHQYLYDSMNNRIQKDENQHEINSLNQLINDSISHYKYDLNGNLTAKGDVTYTYDALDRLIQVKKSEEVISYVYDHKNRRLSKTTDETKYFLYENQNEVGSCNENHVVNEFRVLGLGKGSEIGAAVFIELQEQVYIPIHDHNGNVMALHQNNGVIETYRYSAYGEEENLEYINPWRFSSKRFDPETQYYNFGRRYYDPDTGKWITPDPQGFEDGPNLYAYVHNRPLNFYDLYGLSTQIPLYFHEQHRSVFGKKIYSPSQIVKIGEVDYNSREIVIGMTGMYNSLEDTMNVGNKISDYHSDPNGSGRQRVTMIHNSHHNVVSEGIGAVMIQMFGVTNHPGRLLRKAIYREIARMGGLEYVDRINLHVHSKGVAITNRVLRKLPKEITNKIHVSTYGGPWHIPKDAARGVLNYVDTEDGISKTPIDLAVSKTNDWKTPPPYAKGVNNNSYDNAAYRYCRDHNIVFLHEGTGHSWLGGSYDNIIRNDGKEFLKRA